ncbi:MAG: AAA family ATPase [Anaerohalosphaeraceae bacterium]|nr:AAA family ATPase [Anaerohalosphaeraceae bacterium]
MKPVYISATGQDGGKTSVICGLIQLLREQGHNPGYIKPVGQRYVQYDGNNVDEDAVLTHQAFGFKDNPSDMSPIAIAKGFTAEFIMNPDVSPLEEKIMESYQKISDNHGMVIVEGTGHAGVGSCFGLSNARVAKMLGANVIIVASGGIGKPIDELSMSLALFKQYKVNVIGVILNKVFPKKREKILSIAPRGLGMIRTSLLGALPYDISLSDFSVGRIAEEFNYEVLCGREALGNRIENTVVAAMEPQHVLDYIEENTLIITPGDRIDNILLTLALSESSDFHEKLSSCGLILTGGLKPHTTIHSLLMKSSIPVLTTEEDTFKVTAKMKDLHFKIRADDPEKITKTYELVRENIDIETILSSLK